MSGSSKVSWVAKRTFIHPVTGFRIIAGAKGEDAPEDIRHIKNLVKIVKKKSEQKAEPTEKQVEAPAQNKALGTQDLKGKRGR